MNLKCSDLRDGLLYVAQSGFISTDRQNGTVLHLSVCVFLFVLVCVEKNVLIWVKNRFFFFVLTV